MHSVCLILKILYFTLMNTELYTITRTCQQCQHLEQIQIEKREATFDLIDINEQLGATCSKCNKSQFAIARDMPILDEELILEWAHNEHLFLLEQDEDLILADKNYVDFIFNIIDQPQILDAKKGLLLSALCILIYDEVDENISGINNPLVQKILAFLKKRKQMLISHQGFFYTYIKDIVFPLLDDTYNKEKIY